MTPNLKEQLKSIKNENGRLNPDRVWVANTKADLMKRVGQSSASAKETFSINVAFNVFKGFVPQQIKVAARPVMVVFLVTALSVAGWGATVSANYSLPGDALYGVKRVKEKTEQVVGKLVGGSEGEAKVLLDHKKTRAIEVVALIQQDSLDEVQETLEDLAENAEKIHEIVQDTSEKDPEKAIKIVAESVDAAESVDDILEGAKENTTDTDTAEKIIKTKQEVTEKAIDGVEVIVEQAVEAEQDGEMVLSEEEVGDLVKKTIDNLTNDTEDVVTATEDLEEAVENADVDLEVTDISSTTTKLIEEVGSGDTRTTTPKVVETDEESIVNGESNIEPEDAKAVSEEVTEGLEEAKELAESGQLVEALQKAKDVNNLVGDLDADVSKAVTEIESSQQEDLGDDLKGDTEDIEGEEAQTKDREEE